jgi:hypothetical protein
MKNTTNRPPGNGGKKAVYTTPARKPDVLPVNPAGIPAELKAAARWVLWALTWKANKDGTGKWDKVPKTVTCKHASSTNPATWGTFDAVLAAYQSGRYDGIGFLLGDGFAGIDLDDVRNPTTGELVPWAGELLTSAGTYADVSPSGTGVKLFGRGVWAGDWHKQPHPSGAGEVEVYDGGRYFTVTGHTAGGNSDATDIQPTLDSLVTLFDPKRPNDIPPPGAASGGQFEDDELLDRIRDSTRGAKFARLWAGDTSGHGGDDSAADLALCGILAFWCGPDATRIDRLFRRSGLMRAKWDSKRKDSTYGRNTIDTALSGKSEFYTPFGPRATFGGHTNGKAGNREDTIGNQFTPELVKASDVTPVAIPWGWPGRIPLGRGTLVAGRPGLGKTLLLCDIAATVTRGRHWPDGAGSTPAGDVILMSAEDDPADTLVPRLQAAGADLDRVHFLRGAWAKTADGKTVRKGIDLQAGLPLIEDAAGKLPALKLLVIDPIGSYMGRGVDSHRDNEVRGALDGVNRLAGERGFALVFIAHVNKSSLNQFADDSVLGSRAFTGIVRAVHHLIRDPENKGRLLFAPGKCNIAVAPTTLAYTLEAVKLPTGEYPRVVWNPDPIDATADDFIGTSAGRSTPSRTAGGRDGSERAEAGAFLLLMLADGPKPVPVIKKATAAAGHSWGTVKRAKAETGITGRPKGGKFVAGQPPEYWWGLGNDWEFPPDPVPPPNSEASEPARKGTGAEPADSPEIPEAAQPEQDSAPTRKRRASKARAGS